MFILKGIMGFMGVIILVLSLFQYTTEMQWAVGVLLIAGFIYSD